MESHTSALKKAAIILTVPTVIFLAYVGYAISQPPPKVTPGLYYKADVLSARPEKWWNLTDPDQYVLEAINNPEAFVQANEHTTTFNNQVAQHGYSEDIAYNGQYYHIGRNIFHDSSIYGLHYRANVLSVRPEKWWNLTDLDQYVLEAINNPGVWVQVNTSDPTWTFDDQVLQHRYLATVLYDGQYYTIDALNTDPKPETTGTAIGPAVLGLSAAWITLGAVAVLHRNPAKPAPTAQNARFRI